MMRLVMFGCSFIFKVQSRVLILTLSPSCRFWAIDWFFFSWETFKCRGSSEVYCACSSWGFFHIIPTKRYLYFPILSIPLQCWDVIQIMEWIPPISIREVAKGFTCSPIETTSSSVEITNLDNYPPYMEPKMSMKTNFGGSFSKREVVWWMKESSRFRTHGSFFCFMQQSWHGAGSTGKFEPSFDLGVCSWVDPDIMDKKFVLCYTDFCEYAYREVRSPSR